MIDTALPASADGFAPAGDFDAFRAPLFDLVSQLCLDQSAAEQPEGDDSPQEAADGDVQAEGDGSLQDSAAAEVQPDGLDEVSVFPSDLDALDGLSPDESAELYDNLLFNRYLDADGTVLWSDFFADPANAADFWVNADLGAGGARGVAAAAGPDRPFDTETLAADPTIFTDLGWAQDGSSACWRTCASTATSTDGNYVDKRALLALRARRAQPRARVLPAPPGDPRRHPGTARRAPGRAVHDGPETFADIADDALAARIIAGLDGTYLVDGRVADDMRRVLPRRRPRSDSGWTSTQPPTRRSAGASPSVLVAQQPYHLDRAALADLDLNRADVDLLAAS